MEFGLAIARPIHMMIRILLVLSALLSISAKAQIFQYPKPSPDIIELKNLISRQLGLIDQMGPLCQGGGRKWAKIEQLRMLYRDSAGHERIGNTVDTLSEACSRVAMTGAQFDPDGTRLVIPQRITRSLGMFPEEKQKCLQFWGDFFEFQKIGLEQVRPVISRFESECKSSAPSVTGTPITEPPANR